MVLKNSLLSLKLFMRYRTPYIFSSIALLIIISSIFGVFVSTTASSTYVMIQISRQLPIHVYLRFKVNAEEPMSYDGFRTLSLSIIDNLTRYVDELYRDRRVNEINASVLFTIRFEDSILSINDPDQNVSRQINFINILLLLTNSSTIHPVKQGIGVYVKLFDKGIVSENDRLVINITGFNRMIEVDLGKINYVYNYIGYGVYGLGSMMELPPPHLSMDRSTFNRFLETIYRYDLSIRLGYIALAEVGLRRDLFPSTNSQIIRNIVEDVMNNMNRLVKIHYGDEIGINSTRIVRTFFFTHTVDTSVWKIYVNDIPLDGETIIDSPIIYLIDMLSSFQTIQSSALTIELVLPIFISTWFFLITVGVLVADKMRRDLALVSIRGGGYEKMFRSFMFSELIILLITGLTSLPVSYVLSKHIVSIEFPEMVLSSELFFNTVSIVLVTALSILLTLFSSRRVKKYFGEVEFEKKSLYILTQHYVEPPRENWKPSMFLTILFIMACIYYLLYLLGFRTVDLINMASKTHVLVLILVVLYSVINSLLSLFYPAIVTYFIVMLITNNDFILKFFSTIVSFFVGHRFRTVIKDFVSIGLTRSYRVGFIIALIVSSLVAYLGIHDSLVNWLPVYREYMLRSVNVPSPNIIYLLINILESSILSYRLITIYSSLFAIISTVLLSIMLVHDIEHEIVVLSARGSSIRDLVRFMYGALSTIILIGVSVGLIGGLLWLRSSVLEITPFNTDLPTPQIVLSNHSIIFILTTISIIFLTPLLTLLFMTRFKVSDRLRNVI